VDQLNSTAFTLCALSLSGEVQLSDSVAVDAKRILLRYGAPINVLDEVSDEDRITLARAIAKTDLADRETRLKELLAEQGYGS
jgi:hypothetical protein